MDEPSLPKIDPRDGREFGIIELAMPVIIGLFIGLVTIIRLAPVKIIVGTVFLAKYLARAALALTKKGQKNANKL